MTPPQVGTVKNGFQFMGGDPNEKSNWQPQGNAAIEQPVSLAATEESSWLPSTNTIRKLGNTLLPPGARMKTFEDTPEYQQRLKAMSHGEFVEGLPGVRAVRGVEAPILALGQLAGTDEQKANIAQMQADRQAGMAGRDENRQAGTDVMGLAGSMVPTSQIAGMVGKMIPGAGAISRIGQGAAAGGAAAGAQPLVGQYDDVWSEKIGQMGLGAAIGGGVPIVGEGIRLAKGLQDMVAAKFRSKPMYEKWIRKEVGKDYLDDAATTLEQAEDFVPGERRTVAQALTLPKTPLPSGSVLRTHEATTSKSTRGVSSKFEERYLRQEGAREIAKRTRDALTGPMRDDALDAVNATGGVPKNLLYPKLRALENDPNWRDSKLVKSALKETRKTLDEIAGYNYKVDARRLYGLRKNLNENKSFMEYGQAKPALKAKIEREFQKAIDDAITDASKGNPLWKQYLDEYSTRSQAIRDSADVAALAKTSGADIQGGVNIAKEQSRAMLPNWLSKPITFTKWLAERASEYIEPKLDAYASEALLNPKLMASILRKQPGQLSPQYQAMIDAMMQGSKQISPYVASGIAREQ